MDSDFLSPCATERRVFVGLMSSTLVARFVDFCHHKPIAQTKSEKRKRRNKGTKKSSYWYLDAPICQCLFTKVIQYLHSHRLKSGMDAMCASAGACKVQGCLRIRKAYVSPSAFKFIVNSIPFVLTLVFRYDRHSFPTTE